MALKRFKIRTLMLLVLVAAVALALIPIVLRAIYPNTHHHIFFFYIGNTIFSIKF